jgi:hypothetical protein
MKITISTLYREVRGTTLYSLPTLSTARTMQMKGETVYNTRPYVQSAESRTRADVA